MGPQTCTHLVHQQWSACFMVRHEGSSDSKVIVFHTRLFCFTVASLIIAHPYSSHTTSTILPPLPSLCERLPIMAKGGKLWWCKAGKCGCEVISESNPCIPVDTKQCPKHPSVRRFAKDARPSLILEVFVWHSCV